MSCTRCENKAVVLHSKTRLKMCKSCFIESFENDIHSLISSTEMFKSGENVAVGVSGGKDSTVLIYVLNKLNKKYNYGIKLLMICVDEGIAGYRDRSIETVNINHKILDLPLKIVSYDELFGLTMDKVVKKIGKKGNCSYCGVFRRQALEEAARSSGADLIVTGHNADDMAETVLLNLLRGDAARFRRCTQTRTGSQYKKYEKNEDQPDKPSISLPRCKPFKNTYQRDIVFYAYYNNLPYFSTECTYAPNASRGDARLLIKELERIEPEIIINITRAAEIFRISEKESVTGECHKCTHATSSIDGLCLACKMINRLNI